MHDILDIAPEVADALAEGGPVVALESTLIAQGIPFPHNLEVADVMRRAVRSAGATPAVIAVLDGRIRVGLDDAALERIAASNDALKISRRDLAFAVAAGLDGGTTVAATMICARLAGIAVFATGGIGGVHRGATETGDVSADLEELARTPVAVVCAGPKAILDLPRTMEYLETVGVPLVAFGTDEAPAFYMRDSGIAAPMRLDTAYAVARLVRAQQALGLESGIVVARPAPPEAALDRALVERAIAAALDDAKRLGVAGKPLTPFLLDRIAETTGGESLEANAALLANNASLAGEIAVALAASS